MTIRNDWKKELEELRLTTIQKEKIVTHVKLGRQKKKSFVPVILPAFIALALFSIWLSFQPSTPLQMTTAANESKQSIMAIEKIIWLTLTWMLMMSAYTLCVVSLLKVKRWQQLHVVKQILNNFKMNKIIWIIVSLLGFGFALTMMTITVENPLSFLHVFFVIFLFINISLIQILLTRNNSRVYCPHCKVELTNREVIKKSFMAYDAHCNACKQKMHYDKKKNEQAFLIQFIGVPLCILMPNVGISFYLIGIYFMLYVIFTFGYLLPYTIRFSTEGEEMQPPLW